MNRIYQQNFKGEKLIRKNVFDINVLLYRGGNHKKQQAMDWAVSFSVELQLL